MKTWTNPSVEELEVEMTAGGIPMSWSEAGYLPGIWGPDDSDPTPTPTPTPTPNPEEPGKDDTTDGQS